MVDCHGLELSDHIVSLMNGSGNVQDEQIIQELWDEGWEVGGGRQ